jgi:ATP-dependent DNA helicase 2 subunit 1
LDVKHVYVLHELKLPGAEEVKQLEKLMALPGNDDFASKFGHSTNFSLSDALWTCLSMFSKSTQKLGFKRVMLFTDNDNPHEDGQLRRQAVAKVDDLRQNGIDLELMHISPPDKPFDLQAFYKDILYADDDEQTVIPDPAEKFDELLTRVRMKNHKKRALTKIPFTLSDGMNMSVGVYNLVRTCTKPSAVKLYRKTNEEVKSVTKTFLKETGEILMPQDIRKCQIYAGRRITFEPEEVIQMKTFSPAGLELVGFKPRALIKPYFHVRSAQFIYPDESSVKGSTVLFTALLKKCIEKGVVAICRYTARKSSPPRFVALFPQAEEFDDHKVQVTPPGFHVIFLPFADDFRKLKLEENLPRANVDQIEKAKELIKKLQFAFRSESFENPVLQQHYANVEAMALDRETVEEISDFTLPDEEKIEKRAGKISQEFKALVFPTDYQPGTKRKAGGAGGGTSKVVKSEEFDIDIEKEARSNRLNKLTVSQLKECAKKLKIKSAGTKKADLIDAISDHFGL